jgi:hypothetical protein
MNQQASRVLIGGVWLSSIAAAYFLGQSTTTVPSSAPPVAASASHNGSGTADAA